MNKKRKVSLLDREATGGSIAESGFKYQDHLTLARIPQWLAHDSFTEMIREAMGDTEAKFYALEGGLQTEFVEFKDHVVRPGEFWEEIRRFREMDTNTPTTYFRFVLVCKGVSETLKPLLNALRHLRDPYQFYDNAPSIQEASYQDYENVVSRLGQNEGVAKFIFSKVLIEIEATDAEQLAKEVFREQLHKYYPGLEEASGKQVNAAGNALLELVSGQKRKTITRSKIEGALWKHFDAMLRPPQVIRIHTEFSESSREDATNGKIVFHWQPFSGDGSRCYPPSEEWNNRLVKELVDTRDWILQTGRKRSLHLTGSRRLSASLALGHIFSATAGFSIQMEYRETKWRTDNYSDEETPNYEWSVNQPVDSVGDELVVIIGICRDILQDVDQFLNQCEMSYFPRLVLYSETPLTSDKHANKSVSIAKREIHDALASTGASKIHLFFAGPSHFFLIMGHRLNATCTIQCYEYVRTGQYSQTCLLYAL